MSVAYHAEAELVACYCQFHLSIQSYNKIQQKQTNIFLDNSHNWAFGHEKTLMVISEENTGAYIYFIAHVFEHFTLVKKPLQYRVMCAANTLWRQ